MEIIAKLFGLGVITFVIDTVLAQAGRKDIAFGVTIVATVVCMLWVIPEINKLFQMATTLFNLGR